jgi:hypothetical protein
MSQTTFSGPLVTGDRPAGYPGGSNLGYVVLSQSVLINRDATLVQSASINLPYNSQLLNIVVDVLTQYDSATSATLTVGTAAGGTTYASGVNAKTGVRVTPTFTAAQLASMASTGSTGPVVATVTSVGQPTVGQVRVTYQYVQTQSSTD